MCFSAPVSFAASAGLAAAGAGAASKAKGPDRWFAAIPFLFSIQQLLEGLQWVLLARGVPSAFLGYGFLLFAFVLWPTYIPLTVYKMERDPVRRSILLGFIAFGLFASIYLTILLITEPLIIEAVKGSIVYNINIQAMGFGALGYVAIVCGSALVSSNKYLQWFGLALLVTAAISAAFFYGAFTSVWCFFAAIISLGIYWYCATDCSKKAAKR